MQKKMLITPTPLALHTKFKWQAQKDDLSMARIVRALIRGYLDGSFDITAHLGEDRIPTPGRPVGSIQTDGEPDFYDDLYARVLSAVED